jgi:hypothetical protein
VDIFGGWVTNIPPEELLLALLLPPTELIGAWLLLLVHPANHRLTSDNAAIRRKVKVGLPALIYPPKNNHMLMKIRQIWH